MHNNRDKDRGHLGHPSPTPDTAQGKGGGKMTENAAPTAVEENDADDTSPTNRQATSAATTPKNADIPLRLEPLRGGALMGPVGRLTPRRPPA
jgi:hypothetical protein